MNPTFGTQRRRFAFEASDPVMVRATDRFGLDAEAGEGEQRRLGGVEGLPAGAAGGVEGGAGGPAAVVGGAQGEGVEVAEAAGAAGDVVDFCG
jgi:hypothetical protein